MLAHSALGLLSTGVLVFLPACVSSAQHEHALAEVRQTERERSERYARLAEESEERRLKAVEALSQAEERYADLELALTREKQRLESERMLVDQLRDELERTGGHLRHFADEARRLRDAEWRVEHLERKLDSLVQVSNLILECGGAGQTVPATLATTPEGDVSVSLRSSAVFLPGTSKLSAPATKLFEKLASLAQQDPELRFELIHGDAELAEARSQAVEEVLKSRGVGDGAVNVARASGGEGDAFRIRISHAAESEHQARGSGQVETRKNDDSES